MNRPIPLTSPAVGIVPYAERFPEGLALLPLDRLDWPLGRPDRLLKGTVADMQATDHLITYPKTRLYLTPKGSRKALLSMMIVEPDMVHAKHLGLARLFHRRFHRILTKNQSLLGRIPNGLPLTFGSTFLQNVDAIDRTKRLMTSLIASAKREWPGHVLRHAAVDAIRAEGLPVDVMGRGYQPFADKSEGLAPYRYSVVIENTREQSYFTEKLVDALLCETVPIYWGAPDIGTYFDTRGMIVCHDLAEILTALRMASETDYAMRLPMIRKNRALALEQADLHGRAARSVLGSVTKPA